MSCLLINGITKGCRDNIGGINTVYLANKELVASVIVGGGSPSDPGMVTTLTTENALGTPAPEFYEFQVNKNSSNWVDTASVVSSNGGTFYSPAVTTAFVDLNGWTLTLTGGETHPAYEVEASLITASIIVGM